MVERIEHIDILNECRNIKTPKEMENYTRDTELTLIFHDTVPLEEEQLPLARETAKKQRELILAFFRDRFSMNFTPAEVHILVSIEGEKILLTSVRRSITDLTKEGRLIKCDWSERREGAYGKPNRTWRYNNQFVNRLNPDIAKYKKYLSGPDYINVN